MARERKYDLEKIRDKQNDLVLSVDHDRGGTGLKIGKIGAKFGNGPDEEDEASKSP